MPGLDGAYTQSVGPKVDLQYRGPNCDGCQYIDSWFLIHTISLLDQPGLN